MTKTIATITVATAAGAGGTPAATEVEREFGVNDGLVDNLAPPDDYDDEEGGADTRLPVLCSLGTGLTPGASSPGADITFYFNAEEEELGDPATGTVQFYVDEVASGSPVELVDGAAEFLLENVEADNMYTVVARYLGDETYAPNFAAFSEFIPAPGGGEDPGYTDYRLLIRNTVVGTEYISLGKVEFRVASGTPETHSGGIASPEANFAGDSPAVGGAKRVFETDGSVDYSFPQTTHWPQFSGSPTEGERPLSYRFPTRRVVEQLMIKASPDGGRANQGPKDFDVQASNDGVTWDTLLVVTGTGTWTAGLERTWSIPA